MEQKASMDDAVLKLLLERMPVLRAAMREIAESYLLRGIKQKDKPKEDFKKVPKIVLSGRSGKKVSCSLDSVARCIFVPLLTVRLILCLFHTVLSLFFVRSSQYKPVKFIARGSAGAIYSCVQVKSLTQIVEKFTSPTAGKSKLKSMMLRAISKAKSEQLVLKRIEPTQKDSAENEYRIASLLSLNDEKSRCVAYLDRLDESPQLLWLLLERINPSPYGVDLKEYIEHDFFVDSNNKIAQEIAKQLLDGLEYIASRGVIMRDVKADNVLIEYSMSDNKVSARWSDFGLSVDVGDHFDSRGIRSPKKLITEDQDLSDQALQTSLVGFWYDTQKLVPKPTWKNRRPPEQGFRNPEKVYPSSYDIYMLGIIFVSMATNVDLAHINKKDQREKWEETFNIKLAKDYLETLEIGEFISTHKVKASDCFQRAFGVEFGAQLFKETCRMLAQDPRERPRPLECLRRLDQGK